MPTIYFANGTARTVPTVPTRHDSTTTDSRGRSTTTTHFTITLPDPEPQGATTYAVHPTSLPDTWAEDGNALTPPRPGDRLITTLGEETIVIDPFGALPLCSAIRPGVYLVTTSIGDLLWVRRRDPLLPIWQPASIPADLSAA